MLFHDFARILAVSLAPLMLFLAGCGTRVNLADSDDPDAITPPVTAGTHEQLLGTSWVFEGLDMTVTFQGVSGNASDPVIDENAAVVPAMTALLSNPEDPNQNIPGYWRLRPNGVITVSVVGNTRAGTWDGQTLILGGETGVPL